MKTEITVNRKTFTIDDTDLILDNGACYQILSKNTDGKYCFYHDLSKKLFRELRTLGGVYTSEGLRLNAVRNHAPCCTYWKFNVEYMVEHLGFVAK